MFIFSKPFNFLSVTLSSSQKYIFVPSSQMHLLSLFSIYFDRRKSSFGIMDLEDRIHSGGENMEAGNRCSSWSRKLKAESSYCNLAHNTERVN